MTEQTQAIIESLTPFIEQITAAPLPSSNGAGGRFYSQIHRIRIEAVSQICCKLLVRTQARHGDQAAESLRRSLDPIRESLLAKFPDLAELLDAETWPENWRH